MSTWKGKTRGGTFGYLFFIYLIKYLGITAAYIFLSLVVLYFIPFAPKATKSTWFYARHILKYSRIRSVGMLLRNYYRLGQILIDKTQLTPARILTGYVVTGVFLSAVGLYEPLVNWGGAGGDGAPDGLWL